MRETYGGASPETRRKFNQAFFKHVIVKDKHITEARLAEPFRSLLTVPTTPISWRWLDNVGQSPTQFRQLLALAQA